MIEKGYGASVIGSSHKKKRLPNQDCFLINNNKNYTLACVCDGLGSKKYSHFASKKLCKIIKKEINKRFKNDDFAPYKTILNIQKTFLNSLKPYNLKNSDTTCMFVLNSKDQIFAFQVGDGMIAIKADELIIINDEDKDFSNETKSFGKSTFKDWKIKVIDKKEDQEYKVLISTDGVSEDLIIDELSSFIDDLSQTIKGKRKNSYFLKNLLKNWPNKYSNDDKTIVVVK